MIDPAAPRDSDRVLERLMGLHPKLIDLSLDRTVDLLERLGRPQDRLPPVVHVAGTNGKGSTVAILRAIAEAAGLTCHVYSSPHLVRFAERIRLAGEIIDEAALTALLEECERVNENRPITFFEITTCAAFKAFSETPADLLLLEVGLGGRLDSTNVIPAPAATAITPVSMDHEQFLGPTLAHIAGEKAAIQKAGVPSIVGPQRPDALAVIEAQAERVGAPLARWGKEWAVEPRDPAAGGGFRFTSARWTGDLPSPGLAGRHQVDNAGTAVALALALADQGIEVAPEHLARGVAEAVWPARLQRLSHGPVVDILPGWEIRLDGGHNPSAGEALAAQAAAWDEAARAAGETPRPLHLVCGLLNTKAAQDFLSPLAAAAQSVTAIEIPGEINSLRAETLAETARWAGCRSVAAAPSLAAAAARLAALDRPPGRLLICGSLYLAGRVLADHG
jgi:dihydrofolate synthase/folylpolyglutamate synthase